MNKRTTNAAKHTQGDNAARDVVLFCDVDLRRIAPCYSVLRHAFRLMRFCPNQVRKSLNIARHRKDVCQMTLIITELSEFGIAMVADSAVTCKEVLPSGKAAYRVLSGVRKLQLVSHLNAGVSMWGLGSIPTSTSEVSTDIWIADFIERHQDILAIDDFANCLAAELQATVGTIKEPLGIHLAGYVDIGGKKLPTFCHVRNVDGTFENYQYHDFIPGQDHPPQLVPHNQFKITRNGDYGAYAALSETVHETLRQIHNEMKLTIPHPSLRGRIAYHTGWVNFLSELYASSGLLRTIGGVVSAMGISPSGRVVYFSG